MQQKSEKSRNRWCQWRRMVRRLRMFCWVLLCWFHQFEKVPNFVVGQALSCLILQAANFFYQEVQHMFTLDLMCMRYLCVSVIHWIMTRAIGSLMCLHDLLMHVYTHVFTFIYSVRLNGCLFHGGGGGFGLLLWNYKQCCTLPASSLLIWCFHKVHELFIELTADAR